MKSGIASIASIDQLPAVLSCLPLPSDREYELIPLWVCTSNAGS